MDATVYRYNNVVVVPNVEGNEEFVDLCQQYFKMIVDDKREGTVVYYFYDLLDDGSLSIFRGFEMFLPNVVNVVDCENRELPDILADDDYIRHVLGSITLRNDQILSAKKSLLIKRGIVQLPTGSGKTEVMSAMLKIIQDYLGYIPTTLVLEPTDRLVQDTVERFQEYGMDCCDYHSTRKEGVSGRVVVGTPKAIYNDVVDDITTLNDVKVFFVDECHHLGALTWHSLLLSMCKIEYSIGLSALAVDHRKVPVKDLSSLEFDEALMVGVTGQVIVNVPPTFYIDKGILAKPCLLQLYNPADEYIINPFNWVAVRKIIVESDSRSGLIASAAGVFADIGFKSLILVATKTHAYQIFDHVYALGYADRCRISFGGGKFLRNKDGNYVDCGDEDIMGMYDRGNINILIGTTHLYEGIDVPNLDVGILGFVGKNPRRIIQGIGRAMRASKSGNYAYIIDFSDDGNIPLRVQSEKRLDVIQSMIGVKKEDTFMGISISDMKNIVYSREGFS